MSKEDLTPNVLAEIENKALQFGISLAEYLESTDMNFCIRTSDGYLLADEDGAVVYGSLLDANEDCHSGDVIISETLAIEQMCNEEKQSLKYGKKIN